MLSKTMLLRNRAHISEVYVYDFSINYVHFPSVGQAEMRLEYEHHVIDATTIGSFYAVQLSTDFLKMQGEVILDKAVFTKFLSWDIFNETVHVAVFDDDKVRYIHDCFVTDISEVPYRTKMRIKIIGKGEPVLWL